MGERSNITKNIAIGLFKANMRLRAKANASDASPITSMSHIKLPVMFVHGKEIDM